MMLIREGSGNLEGVFHDVIDCGAGYMTRSWTFRGYTEAFTQHHNFLFCNN